MICDPSPLLICSTYYFLFFLLYLPIFALGCAPPIVLLDNWTLSKKEVIVNQAISLYMRKRYNVDCDGEGENKEDLRIV